jgi:hypothetical protein
MSWPPVSETQAGHFAANRAMIRNPQAYRRVDESERREALRRMTAAESIAIGEALLTSEIMTVALFPDDDHPRSLAIALGIAPRGPGMRIEACGGGE